MSAAVFALSSNVPFEVLVLLPAAKVKVPLVLRTTPLNAVMVLPAPMLRAEALIETVEAEDLNSLEPTSIKRALLLMFSAPTAAICTVFVTMKPAEDSDTEVPEIVVAVLPVPSPKVLRPEFMLINELAESSLHPAPI